MTNDPILIEAYQKLGGQENPTELEDHQLAKYCIDHFDGRNSEYGGKLGKDMASQVLFHVILDTRYPDIDTTHRIVGQAEAIAEEYFDIPEGHMDRIAVERTKYEEKKAQQVEGQKKEGRE